MLFNYIIRRIGKYFKKRQRRKKNLERMSLFSTFSFSMIFPRTLASLGKVQKGKKFQKKVIESAPTVSLEIISPMDMFLIKLV